MKDGMFLGAREVERLRGNLLCYRDARDLIKTLVRDPALRKQAIARLFRETGGNRWLSPMRVQKIARENGDGTLALLERMGLPPTRENYINAAFLGNPPEELDGELESELPREVQAAEKRAIRRADQKFLRDVGVGYGKTAAR